MNNQEFKEAFNICKNVELYVKYTTYGEIYIPITKEELKKRIDFDISFYYATLDGNTLYIGGCSCNYS